MLWSVWCALCITLLLCVDTCQHVDEVHVTIAQMVCLGRSSEAQQDFETWKGHERINSDQPQKIRLFPDFFQSNSPLPWLHFSNLLDLQVAKVASGVSDSDDDEPAIVAGTVLLGCV